MMLSRMSLSPEYTGRERALWAVAVDFANNLNTRLNYDPSLILSINGQMVTPGTRFEYRGIKDSQGVVFDHGIGYENKGCFVSIFTINEECCGLPAEVFKKLKNMIKAYKEVNLD